MKTLLERKEYYIPIYCYRHFPSIHDIYEKIIYDLVKYGKINLYESKTEAYKTAKSFLCDDDTYTVGVLDFSHGWCEAYCDCYKEDGSIKVFGLDCSANCYKIVK